jgi:hypothetical protein
MAQLALVAVAVVQPSKLFLDLLREERYPLRLAQVELQEHRGERLVLALIVQQLAVGRVLEQQVMTKLAQVEQGLVVILMRAGLQAVHLMALEALVF